MAGYRGHTAGGIVLGLAYVATVFIASPISRTSMGRLDPWQLACVLIVVSVLFALWPDIDTNSKGQDIFYGAAFSLDVALIALGYLEAAAYFGLLAMTPIVGKHRGWTHSRVAMFLIPLPILLVTVLYKPSALNLALLVYGAAFVGYFSHLLLDGRIVKFIRVKSKRW